MGFWSRVWRAVRGEEPRSQGPPSPPLRDFPITPSSEWEPAGSWSRSEAELFERMAREVNPNVDPVLEGLYHKGFISTRDVTTEQRNRARDEISRYVFNEYGIDWYSEVFDWVAWREAYAEIGEG